MTVSFECPQEPSRYLLSVGYRPRDVVEPEGVILHRFDMPSDNLAQYCAEECHRQEVTVDWYLKHMPDQPLFRWTSDEDQKMGLDPWRFHQDLPVDPEEAKERGWRIFVQRKDMPKC